MEWIFYMIVIFCLIDIEEKLGKIKNHNDELDNKKINKNNEKLVLEQYLNKEVCIILNDESEISDQYLFSAGERTIGKIIDFDDTWIEFKYYNRYKKETIYQYLKIKYIESIDEIN